MKERLINLLVKPELAVEDLIEQLEHMGFQEKKVKQEASNTTAEFQQRVFYLPEESEQELKLMVDTMTKVAIFEFWESPKVTLLSMYLEKLCVTIEYSELMDILLLEDRPDHLIYYLYALGIICPKAPDKKIVDLVTGFFRHTDDKVRRAAVFSTSYYGWDRFVPSLIDLLQREANPQVRAMAEGALDILQQYELEV